MEDCTLNHMIGIPLKAFICLIDLDLEVLAMIFNLFTKFFH